MSPSATTFLRGMPPRVTNRSPSQPIPLPRSRPCPASHSVSGTEPTASTTTSAVMTSALSVRRTAYPPVGVASTWATPTPRLKATPAASSRARTAEPTAGPRTPANGAGRGSRTWTAPPRAATVAATSQPMKPAPMTTTRAPGASRACRASASSTVRRVSVGAGPPPSPIGSRRERTPVAMTSPSKSRVDPSSRLSVDPSRSTETARRPRVQRTFSIDGRRGNIKVITSGPATRACLVSGGRL